MRDHGPIIISGVGAKIFDAHEAWEIYRAKNKIENPFLSLLDLYSKVNPSKTEYDENNYPYTSISFHGYDEWSDEDKKEYDRIVNYRKQYMIDRDIWEGKYLLDNYGYNVLSIFAQDHSKESAFQEWFSTIRPCDGNKGSCSIYCEYFNNCNLKENF